MKLMLLQSSVIILIVFLINFSLLFGLMRRGRTVKEVKSGLREGVSVPDVRVLKMNGENEEFKNILTDNKTVFFVDGDCTSCQEMMNSLHHFKAEYVERINFIATYTENSSKENQKNMLDLKMYYMKENDLMNLLNVNTFPFVMQFDANNNVSKRGYLSKYNLVDYLS